MSLCLLSAPSAHPSTLTLPCPRAYRGNMCGIRVPGLPFIQGGAADPSLVISWLVFRYSPSDRQRIYAAWQAKGYVDVLVSWPDARAELGRDGFVAWCRELVAAGFQPCVMFASKDFDAPDADVILADTLPVLLALIFAGVVARACPAWEASLWLSPTQVQYLIDVFSEACRPQNVRLYVHFQQGYGSFQQPGHIFADFWNANVGKLTGLLHQKILEQTPDQYRYDSGGLFDILDRFAGNAFCSPDSGFGHPFDLIALEISAMTQFDGSTSEADGDALGTWAIECPAASGPAGSVTVMGSGNGQV